MYFEGIFIMRDPLFIYARLLDENGKPIEVHKMPDVYSIAQQPYDSWGRYVRVVGNVPSGHSWPGEENYYKVELNPPETRMRQFLKQSMSLPECCITKIVILLESATGLGDIEMFNSEGDGPDVVVAHAIGC
jgi:hypothetical protein